jgi:tRNA threonylcarbamoyladenosine biosynthesis protein TsaB
MKYLTIDTTTKVTALGLGEDGQLIAEGFLHTTKTHSERLIPMLDQLLGAAAWKLQDLDFVGVVRGPGSFTGIRIGIASAQGLTEVLQLPLIGVLSLDTLAWAGYGRSEAIVPILDARKNEWYTAGYFWDEVSLSPDCQVQPRAIEPKQWLEECARLGRPVLFVGDAVSRYKNMILEKLGEDAIILPDYLTLPRGAFAVQEVWKQWNENPQGESVEPYYIRLSEAEVTWAKKEEARLKNNG